MKYDIINQRTRRQTPMQHIDTTMWELGTGSQVEIQHSGLNFVPLSLLYKETLY